MAKAVHEPESPTPCEQLIGWNREDERAKLDELAAKLATFPQDVFGKSTASITKPLSQFLTVMNRRHGRLIRLQELCAEQGGGYYQTKSQVRDCSCYDDTKVLGVSPRELCEKELIPACPEINCPDTVTYTPSGVGFEEWALQLVAIGVESETPSSREFFEVTAYILLNAFLSYGEPTASSRDNSIQLVRAVAGNVLDYEARFVGNWCCDCTGCAPGTCGDSCCNRWCQLSDFERNPSLVCARYNNWAANNPQRAEALEVVRFAIQNYGDTRLSQDLSAYRYFVHTSSTRARLLARTWQCWYCLYQGECSSSRELPASVRQHLDQHQHIPFDLAIVRSGVSNQAAVANNLFWAIHRGFEDWEPYLDTCLADMPPIPEIVVELED